MELSVDRLTKHYGSKIAVDCVSVALKPGIYGLLGENGAGKTTLMRMLCAILESTSGEVFLDGREISRVVVQACNPTNNKECSSFSTSLPASAVT